MSRTREYLGIGQQGAKVPAWYLITVFIVAAMLSCLITTAWNATVGAAGFGVVIAVGLAAFEVTRRSDTATRSRQTPGS